METLKVGIAEDHQLVRLGIISILREEGGEEIKVVAEAGNGKELITKLHATPVDVVLMDIEMPLMNGIETTQYITQNFPSTKVIALSLYDHDEYIIEMMKAGARGYVLKKDTYDIINAIKLVGKEDFYFNKQVTQKMIQLILKNKITPARRIQDVEIGEREQEVLDLLCMGYSNNEIADKICLSVRTVEGYCNKLLEKTNTKNRTQLAIYSIVNGIVDINGLTLSV